ncbi:MAG TPA: twin-arginine translocase TatA/TatE family subunit [Chloroflexota bacterium]|nr:twin-arginine translocase TatA/TatE family subunit [Chloroflexota bacterium]
MGLDWQELPIVLMIILIVFGVGKLSKVGSELGWSTKEFKVEAGNEGPNGTLAASGVCTDEGRIIETLENPHRPNLRSPANFEQRPDALPGQPRRDGHAWRAFVSEQAEVPVAIPSLG